MKRILIFMSLVILLLIMTGCEIDRKDLLEKDQYSIGEVVIIDFDDQEIVLDNMVGYVNVYSSERINTFEEIDSIPLDKGVFKYSFNKPGNYKLILMVSPTSNQEVFDISIKITIK